MQLNRVTQAIFWAAACMTSGQILAENREAAPPEGELVFDTLTVSAEKTSPKAKTFSTAGAVSYVGEEKQMRSLDSTIRALPGTYTNINPTQGTVNVNIRGLSGFGRVNSMIDGVPQTFYGTSSNSASRYHQQEEGGYGPSSSFGAMIDPNFLVGIEINRGANHGAESVNALSGSSNLRTIGVDDVVMDGNQLGVLSKMSYGSNGIGKSGMLAVGGKQYFSDHHTLGAFLAYSGSKSEANYKRGDGSYSGDNDYVRRLDQKPESWLSKVEWNVDAHKVLLSGRGYKNDVGGRQTQNKSYALNYEFNPESKWVNLKLLAAVNRSNQRFHDDANIWLISNAKTYNDADYVDLNNTSLFTVGEVDLALNYGINLLKNRYRKQATGVNEDNETYTPFAPQGKQTLRSGYLVGDFTYHDFGVKAGLTYTNAVTRGYKPPCDVVVSGGNTVVPQSCFPVGAAHMKMTAKSLQPAITFSYKASDWFQPFVSYRDSMRIPNIQEIFFSNEGAGSMNPFLKPEYAKTIELGFNTDKKNVFVEDDFLGIKLVGYHRKVKNFIHSRSFYLQADGSTTGTLGDDALIYHAQMYVNQPDKLTHKGLELDFNYDAGSVFANLAYAYQKTDVPPDVTATVGTGFGTQTVTTLPKHVVNLTVGGRAFNQALEMGATLKYTGKSQRYYPQGLEVDNPELLQDLPKMPLLVDLYANYQLNKHVLLKASIQNLTNKNYVDALNSLNSTSSQVDVDNSGNNYVYSFSNAARGRTYLVGAEVRF